MPPLKAFRSVLGILTELDGNPQFSLAQLDFLLMAEELGPIAPLDAARRLKLSKQAAYRTITTLEKASLLTRELDASGTAKKRAPVMLTEAARDVLRRVSKVLTKAASKPAKAAAKPAKAAAKPAKTANAASAVPKTSVARISRARARGAIAARH